MPLSPVGAKKGPWTKLGSAILVLVILGAAITLQKAFPPRARRFVIIHSDDAGMYPSVNQATIDAMERGLVSSCSILAACPAFDEFAQYARTHQDKDFGLHLNLTCEKDSYRWGPVLGAKRVPSLVDEHGFFWKTTEQVASHAKIGEVESELRAQIARCRAAGISLSHLDHHMFVLFKRADFIRLYVRLGIDYGLAIRYSLTTPDDIDPNDQERVKAYNEGIELLRDNGLPLCAVTDGDNYPVPADQKRTYFLDSLRSLKPGVTEIIIHCAYVPSGPMRAPAAERRAADTRIFMSLEIEDELRRQGIRVLSWRSFREMVAGTRHQRDR